VSGMVLRQLERRPADEAELYLQGDSVAQAAPPSRLLIDLRTVAAWLGWPFLLSIALSFFPTGFPASIFFLAFGYGPTVGVLQAWLIHSVITAGQPDDEPSILSWLLPPALFSPAAGFLVASPVAALIFSTCGKTHGCTFGEDLVYLPSLAAGLALGLVQWWQLRLWVRSWRWGVAMVAVQTAAPLLLAATALFTLSLLTGGAQIRSRMWPQRFSLEAIPAAAVGSLTVALVVGVVLWLTVRSRRLPEPQADSPDA
jgi:hypothetical protein